MSVSINVSSQVTGKPKRIIGHSVSLSVCVQGKELKGEVEGILAMKQSWPSIMRTLFGDHKRYEETYFSAYKVQYCMMVLCLIDIVNSSNILSVSSVWEPIISAVWRSCRCVCSTHIVGCDILMCPANGRLS